MCNDNAYNENSNNNRSNYVSIEIKNQIYLEHVKKSLHTIYFLFETYTTRKKIVTMIPCYLLGYLLEKSLPSYQRKEIAFW